MKKKVLLILITVLLSIHAFSQEVVRLYKGAAQGSESWNWDETIIDLGQSKATYNVSKPSLTIFQADPSVANGKAVVVCPGGAFHLLSMDNEGYDVAKWLNSKGITVFVLKYRLQHCLTNNPIGELVEKQPNSEKFNKDIEPLVAMDIADGKAAVAFVRDHAAEYGVKPDQIGIMGFSAGGTVATGVAMTYDAKNRPDFVAAVYPYVGSFGNPAVPVDAPPLFIAAAADDNFGFQKLCLVLFSKWNDAKRSAELHIYNKGGHGFGMEKRNAGSDNWTSDFEFWMVSKDSNYTPQIMH
jgi:acetyl esterase/lipase